MAILGHIRESAGNGDVKSMGITSSDAALLGLQQAAGKETGTGSMGKEGSEPKAEGNKRNTCHFWKTSPSRSSVLPAAAHSSAATKYLPQNACHAFFH